MGKLYSLISALLLTVCVASAAEPVSYEYWFDSDYRSMTSGNFAEGSKDFSLEISSPPQGAHCFNIRFRYSDGNWGSIYRRMVLTLQSDVNATAYEYWLDNDYNDKTEGKLSSGTNSYEIDLSRVSKGLHRFCYHVKTA